MDLSFRLPDPVAARALPAADLAQLVALIDSGLGASATAQVQAALGAETAEAPLAPAHGAFNAAMAARIIEWKQE